MTRENTCFLRTWTIRDQIFDYGSPAWGLGGPGTSKTRVFSSICANELQKCCIFSYVRGLTREIPVLMGHPFWSILGSIWHPRADIKIYCFFSRMFNRIFSDLWSILKHFLRIFQPGTVLVRYRKTFKNHGRVVKIKGSGIRDQLKNKRKNVPKPRSISDCLFY